MPKKQNRTTLSYKKLFHLLVDLNMKDVDLRKLAGISAPTVAKLHNDEVVQTDVIAKICTSLHVQPSEIMENIPAAKETE